MKKYILHYFKDFTNVLLNVQVCACNLKQCCGFVTRKTDVVWNLEAKQTLIIGKQNRNHIWEVNSCAGAARPWRKQYVGKRYRRFRERIYSTGFFFTLRDWIWTLDFDLMIYKFRIIAREWCTRCSDNTTRTKKYA